MVDRIFPIPTFASCLTLPDGWEEKKDPKTGKKYFVDHVGRRSTYDDPRFSPLPRGWEMKWDSKKKKPYFSDYHTRTTTYTDPRFPKKEQPPSFAEATATQNLQESTNLPSYITGNTTQNVPAYANFSSSQTSVPTYAQVSTSYSNTNKTTTHSYLKEPSSPAVQNNNGRASIPQSKIVINGKSCSPKEVMVLRRAGSACKDGKYWYDNKSGAFGVEGGACFCYFTPGLRVGGPLQANASNGNTGVFINGRQMNHIDVRNWYIYIAPCVPGRYSLDGKGNCSFENGQFIANIYEIMRRRGTNQLPGASTLFPRLNQGNRNKLPKYKPKKSGEQQDSSELQENDSNWEDFCDFGEQWNESTCEQSDWSTEYGEIDSASFGEGEWVNGEFCGFGEECDYSGIDWSGGDLSNCFTGSDLSSVDLTGFQGMDYSGMDFSGFQGMDFQGYDYSAFQGMDFSAFQGMDYSAFQGMDFSAFQGMDFSAFQGMDYSAFGGGDCSIS